jgi:ATP-dependent DNA helicase RecG
LEAKEFLPEFILEKHKYINRKDALNKMHFPNSEIDETAAKKRFAYEEIFLELLQVLERKKDWQANLKAPKINNKKFAGEIKKLIQNLPFKLSASQEQAVTQISQDVAKPIPMNRLLEGDVGSGKTIVAVVISFLTHLNGYKTMYMAPTEILANQHFETFDKFLRPLGIKVQLKTGSTKTFDPTANIIIGTHALIHLEEKLDKVGLIIIDEQHRFGVSQRAKLLELGNHQKTPHLLTMTATPIPRTLALTIYGDLEISNLEMPENKKKNTKTWVLNEAKRSDALVWVAKQEKPTFIVCPLIEQSEHESLENVKAAEVEFEKLKKTVFKGKKIGLLHGRMNANEKQQAIEDFRSGKIQILVSTPVIEVGVDIPDASIMVIESAERYGLASLHQLRGRVGRQGQESYCIIFSANKSPISLARLKNLEKYDSGLKLAEIDFSLRGQGNLYGTQQHGYVTFKVANLSDVALLEQVKKDAKETFDKLDEFPELQLKLKDRLKNIGLVGNN